MKNTLLSACIAFSCFNSYAQSQCDSAVAGSLMLHATGNGSSRSAVAYNPVKMLYYTATAGNSTYPLQTFDSNGTPDTSAAALADLRGLWWNSNVDSLEGNAYAGQGIYGIDLDPANGYAKGAQPNPMLPGNQINANSCATYDADSNEIVIYNSGSIMTYNGSTDVLKSSVTITGLPVSVSNLNYTFVGYTGIVGQEYIVYDYSLKKVYFIDRSGAYQATSSLPASAPASSAYFLTSYANNIFWLYNSTTSNWESYFLHGVNVGVSQNMSTLMANANSATYQWIDCSTNSPIAGVINQSYTPSASGSYAVIVTEGSCMDTSACFAVSTVVTSITSGQAANAVDIYPNPNNGTFTISLPYSNAQATVYNSTGLPVTDVTINAQQYTINLDNQSPGVYYLVVNSNQGGKITRKIIVQ